MSVESSASNISQLNPNWPTAEDFVSEGDDHIRLLKKTLKQTFPNVKESVDISDVQLNSLAKTVSTTDTGDKLTINGNLVVEKDGYGQIGKADFKLSELTDTTIVNVKMLRELTMPVGTIVTLNIATAPADLYGFGTWTAFGAGRVMIGTGQGTDDRGEARNYVLGSIAGEFAHVLTEAEVPSHSHAAGGLNALEAGAHSHTYDQLQIATPSPDTKHNSPMAQYGMQSYTTNVAGAHIHQIGGITAATGGGGHHNNMQPFIAVAMWVRTA